MKILKIKCKDKIFECLLDEDTYGEVREYNWTYNKKTGVTGRVSGKNLYLHRLLTKCPVDFVVDHINHNNLDNRMVNLRVCTQKQNAKNQKISKNNTSGYKGVVYDSRKEKLHKRWIARIKANRKGITLGRFFTKEEAAKAYNVAAEYYFGQFADLNIIKE